MCGTTLAQQLIHGFLDSVEPLWGHYPSTSQLISKQCWPRCHHVCAHPYNMQEKKQGPNQTYSSFLSTWFLLKLIYELLCVFLVPLHGLSPDQRVQTSCFSAHVLILFLRPLIFSAPLTFNPCHSWWCRRAGLFSWAFLEPPTVTVQLSV